MFITGLALALSFAGFTDTAEANPSSRLIVDMPHGACRLEVDSDGGGSLAYGAMPRWVYVRPGTFDFKKTKRVLRDKSYPQSERTAAAARVGTLSLPGSEELLLIDDHALVEKLMVQAWRGKVAPETARESEDHLWISKACSLQ
jgi:hypothetical protein